MGVPSYPTQDWTEDLYESTHIADTDLQNIELNFATLKNSFAGAGAPSNAKPGMMWFETDNKIMKVRNAGDSTWLGIVYGSTSLKIWVYANAAGDGMVVDSGVTDRVLALKGGSTYTTGGAQAGSWTQPNHTLTIAQMPSHRHVPDDGRRFMTGVNLGGGLDVDSGGQGDDTQYTDYQGGDSNHNHGTTYRPYAAVGTMQYPNI